jgi:hypothetical protein
LKDLALGAVEQRIEHKVSKYSQNIEFLHNNMDKEMKISFKSNKFNGIYQIVGKVVDITPDYIHIRYGSTNYPGGIIQYLNTSRVTDVELCDRG